MIKVSIIIPVYNVDLYLNECINSIIKQTFKNFEIILVDDGSIDKSGDICDEYSSKYSFINVLHKMHEGVSIARNKGIELSRGEFIVFIDADDNLNENYLSYMVSNMEKYNCEICSCNYNKVSINEVIPIKLKVKHNDNFIKMICDERKLGGFLWNKIYKSDIIKSNNILFESDIDIMEDLIFNIRISDYVKNMIHVDKYLYNYRQRPNSAIYNKKNYNNFIYLEKIISELERFKSNEVYSYKLRYLFENEKCKILNIRPNINCIKHEINLKKYGKLSTFAFSRNFKIKIKILALHFFPKLYKR